MSELPNPYIQKQSPKNQAFSNSRRRFLMRAVSAGVVISLSGFIAEAIDEKLSNNQNGIDR